MANKFEATVWGQAMNKVEIGSLTVILVYFPV
jgi:hypothetical protein